MSYNLLKHALSISNSDLCLYDNPDAYSTDFNINGNVDGWDIYNNIYLYGCWGGVLFGTARASSPYISRSEVFQYINAEDFYYVKLMLKITDNNQDAAVPTLTKAKIQWTTIQDPVWDSDKEYIFDLIIDNQWRLYNLNLGPEKFWVGEVNNLRIYPFIDGREGDQFAIKYIRIGSLDNWLCTNTSCSYYLNYEHPCPGAGSHGYIQAEQSYNLYTTVSGISDTLEINIDGYGYAKFSLGNNININGKDLSRVIGNALSSLDIGGYAYATVIHTEYNKIKILSGTAGTSSSVSILDNACARVLGFFDSLGQATYISSIGSDIATGFDYSSTKLLTSFEINQLINGDKYSSAYIHLPKNYSLEVGRQDYSDVGMNISSTDSIYDEYNPDSSLANRGNTIVDWSHPVNNNGILKKIIVSGKRYDNAKIKICRPRIDGTLDVIYDIAFPSQSGFYTRTNVMHSIDCDVLVSKGDVMAFYDFDLSTGTTMTGLPDATYSQVHGEVSGNFFPGKMYSYGVGGFIFYGRSNRYQSNTILDIDLGSRYNVEQIDIYGDEEAAYFEYNIVSCLDVSWSVDLHGGTHKHNVVLVPNAWTDTHTNIAYGISCLGDMVRTAENGKAGNVYTRNSTGIVTTGEHSYFYVNGDAEWLQPEEYDPQYTVSVYDFSEDKITFNLNFPQGVFLDIHKSVIYFKERNNFRSFALYYYLGPEDLSGNYLDTRHRLIPSFTNITLDGIKYYPDHEYLKDYLFINPCSATIEYGPGGKVKDFDHLRAVTRTDWLVLEHEFLPVRCQGFNVECSYHNSTKVTEMEVYSRIAMEPSLIDNVLLQYSSYGDVWKTAIFEKDQLESKISASVGGAPRYFRAEFESPINFYLNELEFIPGEQVTNTDCSKDIMLSEAAIGKENSSTVTHIYNMYDKAFDLYVDIPRNLSSSNNILFWSSLDSQDRIDNPQVGPGCIINSREVLPIANVTGQCAINVPAYGLKNLVHSKKAYVCYNTDDWFFYDTLSSGTSIAFTKGYYDGSLVTTIEFPATSARYWKVVFASVSQDTYLKDIMAYTMGTRNTIERVYTKQLLGGTPLTSPIASNGVDIDLSESYVYSTLSDNFTGTTGDPPNPRLWEKRNPLTGTIEINLNKLSYNMPVGATASYDYVKSIYFVDGDFDIQIDITALGYGNSLDGTGFELRCYINSSNEFFIKNRVPSATGFHSRVKINGVSNEYYVSRSNSTGKLRIKRSGNTVTTYRIDGSGSTWSQHISVGGFPMSPANIYLGLYSPANGGTVTTSLDNFVVNSSELFYFNNLLTNKSIGFRLQGDGPLNKIKLVHGNSLLDIPQLYVSNDNITYYAWKSASEYTISTITNHIKFAIDLEKRHNLDILRNYGSMSNKYVIPLDSAPSPIASYISFYNTETTIPALAIDSNFILEREDSVSIYEGIYVNAATYIPVSDQLRLTDYVNYQNGELLFTDIASQNFMLSYKIYHGTGSADASFFFWNCTSTPTSEDSSAGGYVIAFDEWNSNTVQLKYNGTSLISVSSPFILNQGKWYDVTLIVYNSKIIVYLDGALCLDYTDIYRSPAGTSYGFGARTGGANNEHSLKDIEFNVITESGNTSDKTDTRWLNFSLLSTETAVNIDKLGIYPNITQAYCLDGGYNCEWEDLGTILSDYSTPTNIAFGAEVSGLYFGDLIPENAVNGDYINSFWGFEDTGEDPYVEILFDQIYTIDKVIIYHGYNDTDTTFLNTSYTLYVSTTASGNNFTQALNVTGNTDTIGTHIFTPVNAYRAKLVITGYNSSYMDIDGDLFHGSFIREIEIYNKVSTGTVSSEEYPIVCMDLLDKFNITNHKLDSGSLDTSLDWDNSEEFFYYSDSLYNSPNKVDFSSSDGILYILNSTDTTGDLVGGLSEYTIAPNLYIPAGVYNVTWECWDYDAGSDEQISIRLDGNEVIDIFATNGGNDVWTPQSAVINVNYSGFYDIIVKQHSNPAYHWGARYVKIFRSVSFGKWIAVKRDTATEYSYDADPDKFGADYLDLFKVYSSNSRVPTEYSWWWEAGSLSTLSNDYLNVKENTRSLKIDYPASNQAEYIKYYPGDDFGIDEDWSIKDFLSFWFYISDISLLDLDSTSIEFGFESPNNTTYYKWFLSEHILSSGWNKIRLKFEDYALIVPQPESYYNSLFIERSFDLQKQSNPNNYLKFNYKGIGQPFTIYLTDISIERNKFDDDVHNGKGLLIYDHEYLLVPVSGLTLNVGTIEMWVKPYYDSKGTDIFGDTVSRTIFSIVNNSNNIVSLGVKAGNWFELVFGHEREDINLVNAQEFTANQNAFNRDISMHVAVVWDATGEHTGNGDTLRFYVNSKLAYSSKIPWEVKDNKSTTIKLGGGNSPLAYNYDVASGGGIFRDLKIYDYCKNSFDNYVNSNEYSKTYEAEDFMFISKDDINFYGVGSLNLPLIFEKVPAGNSVPIYIKTIKNTNFKYSNKTADLMVTWLTSV